MKKIGQIVFLREILFFIKNWLSINYSHF